jgi:hypothetical protein
VTEKLREAAAHTFTKKTGAPQPGAQVCGFCREAGHKIPNCTKRPHGELMNLATVRSKVAAIAVITANVPLHQHLCGIDLGEKTWEHMLASRAKLVSNELCGKQSLLHVFAKHKGGNHLFCRFASLAGTSRVYCILASELKKKRTSNQKALPNIVYLQTADQAGSVPSGRTSSSKTAEPTRCPYATKRPDGSISCYTDRDYGLISASSFHTCVTCEHRVHNLCAKNHLPFAKFWSQDDLLHEDEFVCLDCGTAALGRNHLRRSHMLPNSRRTSLVN